MAAKNMKSEQQYKKRESKLKNANQYDPFTFSYWLVYRSTRYLIGYTCQLAVHQFTHVVESGGAVPRYHSSTARVNARAVQCHSYEAHGY